MNSKTLKSAPASKSKSTPAPKTTSKPDAEAAPPWIDKHASRPKEFAHTSAARRRLNDIAPELSGLGRKKSANPTSSSSHKTPAGRVSILYPAQQLAMQMAREEAVWRYRVLKTRRIALLRAWEVGVEEEPGGCRTEGSIQVNGIWESGSATGQRRPSQRVGLQS
ncbi:hypothetical protein B0H14DRAFT_3767672 [Mycena olivaceomarginata]|nr:hypothetical protein B0H14DRAFT_3767672 [Mycena olivaceomarginata]